MERNKKYEGQFLRELGWKKLISLSQKIFGDVVKVSNTVYRDSGTWSYDKLEDFLSYLNPEKSDIFLDFCDGQRVRICHYEAFSWDITSPDKSKIVSFETEADDVIAD